MMRLRILWFFIASLAVVSHAWASEVVETFETSGFTNHKVLNQARTTDVLTVSIEAGGSGNMKEVTGPAALFVGFDPSAPVTELSIKSATQQPFSLSRLRLTNQFDMTEQIRIASYRSGIKVGNFTATVPWPTGDVVMPADSSFESVDEVRISGTDMYFYLEDVAVHNNSGFGAGSNDLAVAEPIPLFQSWFLIFLLCSILALMARRHLAMGGP